MINYPTLSRYFAKIFLKQFFFVSAIILCVLCITNAFDVLQKFKSVNVSFDVFWRLVMFKVPYLFNEVSTLICFIATFMFLRDITKQNELVIVLSSGVSIWRIFIIPIFVTFVAGVIIVSVINPIATYGLQKYEMLESRLNKIPRLNFVVSQSGLLFFESFAGNNHIIQAKSINVGAKSLTDVTVLMIDEYNNLTKRIDAPFVQLKPGAFELKSPIVNGRELSSKMDSLSLPTNLSFNNLIQRFSPPEMIPIWKLKNSIEKFALSGLVVTKYQIYYYKQLFKPIAMVAMALVACWFVNLNIRDGSRSRIALLGLITGIGAYFFLEISLRVLAYSGLYPSLAILLPILFIILISNFVILHFQED